VDLRERQEKLTPASTTVEIAFLLGGAEKYKSKLSELAFVSLPDHQPRPPIVLDHASAHDLIGENQYEPCE
jgi:hypothetical protein